MALILEGAYWISSQQYRRYLKADACGAVQGVDCGPRGIEILDSAPLRACIWLAEKTIAGKSFRFRNYETGFALDVKEQSSGHEILVVATRGSTESQAWEVNQLDIGPPEVVYQIKNVAASTVLCQFKADDGRYTQFLDSWQSRSEQMWLIEPVILPSIYWLAINASSVLQTPNRPNASDGVSAGITLAGEQLWSRDQLWTFEYTSLDETIIRSASHHRFVLDLAPDFQTVLARKYHGGSTQIWRLKDEDEQNNIISLVNARTGTALVTRAQKFFAARESKVLVVTLGCGIHWQIYPIPWAPLFWVTIQSSSTGDFLAQANDRSIVVSGGVRHLANHSTQWRFIMVNDGMRYVIVNRATGFVLDLDPDYCTSAKDGNRDHASCHWKLSTALHGFIIINSKSNKILQQSGTATYCPTTHYYRGLNENSLPSWSITPSHDNIPSFAIANVRTGQCLANDPIPDVGTVSTVKDVNSFCSQWMFYSPAGGPEFALINKMSGNSLESYENDRAEAYQGFPIENTASYGSSYGSQLPQCWSLVPLKGRQFALSTRSKFLHDSDGYGPQNGPLSGTTENQAFCWYLVSHREPSFDFLSLDFDILQQLLTHAHDEPSQIEALRGTIGRLSQADFKIMKWKDNTIYTQRTTSTSRTVNHTLRVFLAHAIGEWVEHSIPKSSESRTVISVTRNDLEKRWGTCLSERVLRRRSDEPGWIRIDLQGVHDIGDGWVADIRGKWLDLSIFQVIIPVDIHVGRAVIQRAMLQSLDQRLTVEVRTTPPEPAVVPSGSTRPGVIYQKHPFPQGLASSEKEQNSLIRILGSIEICTLKHDKL